MQRTLSAAVLAIGLVTAGNARAGGNDMAKTDGPRDVALEVIEAAMASLRDHPNQLSISIKATGLEAKNTGGVGFNSSPTITGGSGSYTGFKVEGVGNVQALQGAANEVATKQSAETVEVLKQIREALQAHQPDKARSLLTKLKEKAVDVIYKVVEVAVLARLGLPAK
jgi:DnaJ-domain-containing protein 1